LFINEERTSRIVLNQEQLHKLDTLIEQTDLNHHLEEAKKDMAVIKEFIGSNFSITDLMMDVGSHQLRKHRWPRPD
jgi:hypothetical protein